MSTKLTVDQVTALRAAFDSLLVAAESIISAVQAQTAKPGMIDQAGPLIVEAARLARILDAVENGTTIGGATIEPDGAPPMIKSMGAP